MVTISVKVKVPSYQATFIVDTENVDKAKDAIMEQLYEDSTDLVERVEIIVDSNDSEFDELEEEDSEDSAESDKEGE